MNHIYYLENSYIHFIVNDNIYILTLKSFKKGEGTILLNYAIDYSNHIHKNILLDDISIRYRQLNNINVEKAELLKGAFSMEDCRKFLTSYKILVILFSDASKLAGEKELEAFIFFVQGVKIQQAKGTFTMEYSINVRGIGNNRKSVY